MLTAYAEMVRSRIESHGGVVEKFIGDAVVGVFGVPAAHEDDPERAVRAGLRIVEGAEELRSVGGEPLRLRVGVNTGEALVRLGASAGLGERVMSGDAINTASRIQSVAPAMGVAVGLATHEATAAVFDYKELEAATVKGKAEPVRVFHAKAARARFGTDLTRTHDTPFIGREIDLALLKGIFDKTVASSSVQLVTVVGEPGLGKTRLVAELFAYIDARPDFTTWRQGPLPLVRGGDHFLGARGDPESAHRHPRKSTRPQWRRRSSPPSSPTATSANGSGSACCPCSGSRRPPRPSARSSSQPGAGSWRRSPRIARPCSSSRTCTGRTRHSSPSSSTWPTSRRASPCSCWELLAPSCTSATPSTRRGSGMPRPITLAPLSHEETARLVSALLETTVIPAELQQPILERAGGNPLYAEEFVRLLRDRDLLERVGSSWQLKEGADVPFPESVQALIAARLDTLKPEAKSLLADAAVIGKVFWAGALAAMGERGLESVTSTLRELSRKELVRPLRQSSMAGEAEYTFSHVLARDVAYNQLPRTSRATRHVAAARWIESKVPERVEDLADVLAHHYTSALELARDAGEAEQAAELEAPALRFLSPRRRTLPRPRHRRRPRELRAGARAYPARALRAGRGARPLRRGRLPGRTLRGGEGRARRGDRRFPMQQLMSLRTAKTMGLLASVLSPARGSRLGGAPRGGGRLTRTTGAQPGTRWGAHRARPRRAPTGTVRGRPRLRRAGARPRRGAWSAPACPRPRLPRPSPLPPRRPRRPRRLPGRDHARHRGRAGTRGRPLAQQPRVCANADRRPRRRTGAPAGGDRIRPGPRSHRGRRHTHGATPSRPSSRRANTTRRSPSRTSSPSSSRRAGARRTSSQCGACRPRSSRCVGRRPRWPTRSARWKPPPAR